MKSKVRPQLSDLVNTGTLEIEKFQNDTIRPIIKMQHNFLIISFKNYIKKSKTDFYNIKEEHKVYVLSIFLFLTLYMMYSRVLMNAHTIQQTIVGSLIGYFLAYYYYIYIKNKIKNKKKIYK